MHRRWVSLNLWLLLRSDHFLTRCKCVSTCCSFSWCDHEVFCLNVWISDMLKGHWFLHPWCLPDGAWKGLRVTRSRNVRDNSIQVRLSRRNHIQIKSFNDSTAVDTWKSLYPQLGACQEGKCTFKLHTVLSQSYLSHLSWAPTDSTAIWGNPYWRLLDDLIVLGFSQRRPI